MRLKDKLTLVYIPFILLIILTQVAVVLGYFLFFANPQNLTITDLVINNQLILVLLVVMNLITLGGFIWVYRIRLQRLLVLKLEYLNQFIRDFAKADPIPIDGLIPETDEIEQLLESVLVMRNNYAIQKKSLEKLAYFDRLTGLPNKEFLIKELAPVLDRAKRKSELVAILHLELRNFREINENLGSEFGDKLIKVMGKKLEKIIRAGDIIKHNQINEDIHQLNTLGDESEMVNLTMVARIIGVEFVFVLIDIEKTENALRIANRIIDRITTPFIIEQHHIKLNGNIGIAMYPQDGDEPEVLFKHANFALKEANKQGANQVEYFTREMNVHALHKAEIEKNLKLGLESEQFIVQFQPRVNIHTGELVAFEALLRWQSPGAGLIPAAEFMGVAEETNLICEIGNWIFDQVCHALAQWRNAGYHSIRASINISATQLFNEGMLELVENYLQLYGLAAENLEFEITEGCVIKDEKLAIQILEKLSHLGVKISLDEFGHDYSSLKILQAIPLNILKIDRKFIMDEYQEKGGRQLLQSIIAIAKGFDIQTVACGVEEQYQVDFFKESDCDFIQGFYFSRPIAANKVIAFVNDWYNDLETDAKLRF
ncbi:putative bifunctional diguanylate cyclase/phosphodiesterase [Aliikangiella maris]|uniref:EAL domain-containing protein n=2 Tax=Aliikangiella maris TaxID=3162458 RepID=A0ABV3MUL5_9GAMM